MVGFPMVVVDAKERLFMPVADIRASFSHSDKVIHTKEHE